MKNCPNSHKKPEGGVLPLNRRLSLILLSRTGISLGIILLASVLGGLGFAWLFVQRQLAPLVEKNLTQMLNRPVQMGRVEGFSLTGALRFGPSAIPATLTDPDTAWVPTVDVRIDPLKLLFNRTIQLDVTLVKPYIYIEQNSQRRWVSTTIKPQVGSGPIKTELQVLRVQAANVVLVPFPGAGNRKTPVAIAQVNGSGRFLDRNQRIAFDIEGKLHGGGNVRINGQYHQITKQTNLAILGENLPLADISRLIKLPVNIDAGRVTAATTVQLQPSGPATLLGTASIQEVTVRIPQVPQPLTRTSGQLSFKGMGIIQLHNISTIYGQVPIQANGVLDIHSGYNNISALTKPVQLKNLLNTFNLKLPVAASGEVQAELKITGPPKKPVVSGTVVTTKQAKVDRLTFVAIRAGFQLVSTDLSVTALQAIPAVGGQVTGSGRVKLGQKGGVVFDVQAQNLPGDAIARIYGAKLPVNIGAVSAIGQVFGPRGNLQTVVAVQAPGATYPGKGEVVITSGGNVVFRNTTFQVGGGTVTGDGQIVGRSWQASIQASDVPGQGLAPLLHKVPPQLQGLLSGKFNLSGSRSSFKPETIQGTGSARLQLASGTVKASSLQLSGGRWQGNFAAKDIQLASLSTNIPAQLKAGSLTGNFNLSGSLASFQPSTIVGTGSGSLNLPNGIVTASSVQLASGRWQGNFAAKDIQLASLSTNIPAQLKAGSLTGNFNLSGSLASFKPETIGGTGRGRLHLPNGIINADSLQLSGGRWQGNFTAVDVGLASLSAQIPPQLKTGSLTGNFNLSGSLASVKPETIVGTGSGKLNLPNGTVTASNLQLDGGRWQGNFAAENVRLASLSGQVPPELKAGILTGNFNLSGSLASFKPETIQGTGSGNLNLPKGIITAGNLQLRQGKWQGNFAVNDIQLASLSPKIPPQLKAGRLTGNFNLSGSLASFKPETIQGTGSGSLNLPKGIITAENLQLRQGKWQGNFAVNDIQLASLSPKIPPQLKAGRLTGNFNLAGSLASLKPETIQGKGRGSLNLPNGIITAENLQVDSDRFKGSFAANNVELGGIAKLVTPSKYSNLALRGRLSGSVEATGRLSALNLGAIKALGQLRLENFAVYGLDFDPVLTGEVKVEPGEGVNLELAGVKDRIEVVLAPNYRPVSFFVKRDEAIASGKTQGARLVAKMENFPISILKTFAPLPPQLASGALSGRLSGDFDINLGTRSIVGNNVEIDQPIIGRIKGDKLTGSFQYANGVGTIAGAKFQQGDSEYFLNGSLTTTANGPQIKAQLKVAKGQIQNLLTTLQVFELGDLTSVRSRRTYGKAADIQPPTAGLPDAHLITTLRRLSEIDALLAQQRARREASPLPELRDLEGTFSGVLNVAGSLQQGISANFDILGENWKWDHYKADKVIAKGNFEKGTLTLLPLRLETQQSLLAYTGTIGGASQSGQLRVENLPIEKLQEFVNLPINITGDLNAIATISGSIQNPYLRGEVNINKGTLNQTPIQTAQGSFSYADANLNFYSTAKVSGTEPIQIKGSIPYKMPNATVKPANNQISLDLKVQNEGLALLNLLTNDRVDWVQGQGNVDLSVRGTVSPTDGRIEKLVAEGVAIVNNATIKVQALPAPLTNVTGKALFDFDRIEVESLEGKFSNGQVTASGVIPISRSLPLGIPRQGSGTMPFEKGATADNPLTVALDRIALNIKGRYSGGVNGTAVITGTALSPLIGGNLELVNGQVLLEEKAKTATPTTASAVAKPGNGSGVVGFNNLQISLGKGVQITRPPVLNFLGTGNLTVNGTIDDIRPQGIVKLERGQVNLFTTQFRLAGNSPQTAQFFPDEGLVPILDISLLALVPETIRSRTGGGTLPLQSLSSEISDVPTTNLGTVQTVRIQANVRGEANQLAESLELRSNPARSDAEILSLLGGSFVDTLGRGDTTLGLANLAGSALLGNFQKAIGNTLGLSDFRLFPTLITNPRGQTSTLGLGGEVGIDITPKLSASVLAILNAAQQPPQYNLRYRVNDEILLRGSTDLFGNTRAVVEYQNRF